MTTQANALLGWCAIVGIAAGCAGACGPVPGGQGDTKLAKLTPELQADYALFTDRCSKCHSVARAFNQGERDDLFWTNYVRRMRRQPASGIAPEEEEPIVRFLHYYSAELRKERGK
jgi:mono/diheme cytochrome c family protein